MARVDAAEYGLCRRLNRGASLPLPRHIFRVASRLGDGAAWYALLVALPLLYGAAALRAAGVMALTGALGVLIYVLLKRLFVRERPFITPRRHHLALARRLIATASPPGIRCTRCPSPGRPACTSRSCCGCYCRSRR